MNAPPAPSPAPAPSEPPAGGPAAAGAPGEPARRGTPKARAMTRAAARHAAPFLLWIGVMLVGQLMHLTPSTATEEAASVDLLSDAGLYAVRTVLALGALALLRPWRHHPGAFRPAHVLPALAVGAAVFALWALPGAAFWEGLCPWGGGRDLARAAAESEALWSPRATGWPLFAVHLLGSGVAIAFAEEFFWRAYLLRAVRTPDFLDLPVGAFHAPSFLAVSVVFAAEHGALFAPGLLAGLAYGALFLRTRDVWAACLAHAATNLLLGVYVLATGHWEFW